MRFRRGSRRAPRAAAFALAAAAAVLTLASARPEAPVSRATEPVADAVWSHDIEVTIDPAGHSLKAGDRMVVGGPSGGTAGAAAPLRFHLHTGLEITSLKINGAESIKGLQRQEAAPERHLSSYTGPSVAPADHLLITYQGIIHDPVQEEGQLGFVAGDATTGIIDASGVFLDGGTGWIPLLQTPEDSDGPLALYSVTSRVPEPWLVVTQGRSEPPPRGKSTPGIETQRWAAEVPSDGLALVAGRYSVKSIDHKGVRISTYFFADEAPSADLFLGRTAEYLDRFSALLTPYPYSRFDVVENFFTTGYGFPSFTLLGQDVVKMGEMALRPGYVDHEVMHCWWGNYVYPDHRSGNWTEGLTTYFANYMAQERIGEEQAADYRRQVAQKYSLRVGPDVDYPLARFTVKKRDFENELGYGKAAMVFHMLRRTAGDEIFFRVMREFVSRFGGQRAAWSDFRAAFEAATGRDLTVFFSQWIDRAGLPSLALAQVHAEPAQEGYRVTGLIEQRGTPYRLSLPVALDTMAERKGYTVEVQGASTPFSFDLDMMPLAIRLDPEMHTLRGLTPPEIPPCLNTVLEARSKMYVLPAQLADAKEHPYAQMAMAAAGTKGGQVVTDEEFKESDLAGRSLLLFGRPDENRVVKMLLGRLKPSLTVAPDSFTLAGKTYKGADYSLLLSARNPADENQVIAVFFGMSPESLARSRYAFFYGWDSFVAFKGGRPDQRGTFEPDRPSSRRMLVPDVVGGAAAGGAAAAEALMSHVAALTAPQMEGRRPGTAGHEAAAAYIEQAFQSAGLLPAQEIAPFFDGYRQPFVIALADLDEGPEAAAAEVVLRNEDRALELPARPFPFTPTVTEVELTDQVIFTEPERLAALARSDGADSPRLDGGIVVTCERAAPPDATPSARGAHEIDPALAELLAGAVNGAGRLGAAALVIVRPVAGPSAYEKLLSFPSRLSVQDLEEIDARRKTGDFPGLEVFFAGRANRLPLSAPPPELLVVSVGPELGEALFGKRGFAQKTSPPTVVAESGLSPMLLDVRMQVTAPIRYTKTPGVNLVGYLRGADPRLASQAVILGAHYDALGRTEDGVLLAGAVDNAAGVAALLEAARLFSDPALRPKRSLVFAAFDAEEWGLVGSRAMAGRLEEMALDPVAMVNVDSIGSGDQGRVFLIGGSHDPDLRRLVATLAPALGLDLSRDIDAYAFDYGSDFFPFHLAGVRACGFFAADYRSLHRPGDIASAIRPDDLERVSRLAAWTTWVLAN